MGNVRNGYICVSGREKCVCMKSFKSRKEGQKCMGEIDNK